MTLFPTGTITFTITVSNTAGQSATSTATVVVTAPSAPSAVSGFGTAAYTPGTGFLVQITVTPTATTLDYAVQDMLPAGWAATNIDTNGSLDAVNNMVKWGPFFDATPRVLSYTAVPPANAGGAVSFSGTASFDGTGFRIIGDRSLGNRSRARGAKTFDLKPRMLAPRAFT